MSTKPTMSDLNIPGPSVANELKKFERIKMLGTLTGLGMIEDDNDRLWKLNNKHHSKSDQIHQRLHSVSAPAATPEGDDDMQRNISLGDTYNVTQITTDDDETKLSPSTAPPAEKILEEKDNEVAQLRKEMQASAEQAREEVAAAESRVTKQDKLHADAVADMQRQHDRDRDRLKREFDEDLLDLRQEMESLKKNFDGELMEPV